MSIQISLCPAPQRDELLGHDMRHVRGPVVGTMFVSARKLSRAAAEICAGDWLYRGCARHEREVAMILMLTRCTSRWSLRLRLTTAETACLTA